MPQHVVCPKGHESDLVGESPTSPQCPVCGETISIPSQDSDATALHPQVPPIVPGSPAYPELDGYEILGELGRGGMGVVYRARQRGLDRLVAIKMILGGPQASGAQLARFRLEAEAIARIRHPNIVQIFEVGESQERLYFSMEYAGGGSLASKLSGAPFPVRDAARVVETLARAVQAAHEQGLVHRDLKPANVLLTDSGEPKIADFGLVKQLDQAAGQTQSGAILGTPSYMAPEQASGKSKEVGPASDIYALGAILYELLTGQPPFKGATPMETLLQVMEREPVSPRSVNVRVDQDLEAICLRCLEKEPARRYPSALALAEDLERFGTGDAIKARRSSILERLGRTLDRRQHDSDFANLGTMLLVFAPIMFLSQTAVFVLSLGEPPYRWNHLVQNGQVLLMGLVFWRFRPHTVWPTSSVERQVWSLWGAYMLATLFVRGALQKMAPPDPPFNENNQYPIWMLLTGMAFCVMGGNFWGRCYMFGLAFFAVGILIPGGVHAAPLWFGFLWALALTTIGLHLRGLAAQRATDHPAEPSGTGALTTVSTPTPADHH